MTDAECRCFPTHPDAWEYVADVPNPHTQVEWNPYCPVHFSASEAASDRRACPSDCDTQHDGPCDNCVTCDTGVCPTHGNAE